MNARQLEVFRAVMQAGSVTNAANMLNVSQPTVSKILKHTENQMGLKLFNNVRGRLYPTREAEMLFPDADRVFRDLLSLRKLADDLRQGEGGLVRIAASSALALTVMPRVIAKFRASHPRVKVTTHLFPAAEISEMVRTHQADIGLTLSLQNAQTLQLSTAGNTEMVCIMPEGHHLLQLATITPRDIKNETLISFSSDNYFGQILDAAFSEYGITRQIDIQATMSVVAASLTISGAGVSIVDKFTVDASFKGLEWRPFRPLIQLPINVLTSETQTSNQFHTGLVKAVRNAIDDMSKTTGRST